jgi:hypothetical protein
MRTLTISVLVLAASCTSLRDDAISPEPIRVYAYFVNGGHHDPAAGATVMVLGTNGQVIFKAVADREGEATIPARFDANSTQYILAELSPLLISGVRWSAGRREYNLPLQVEPLVNRITVPAKRAPN